MKDDHNLDRKLKPSRNQRWTLIPKHYLTENHSVSATETIGVCISISMLVDDTKMGGKITDVKIIQSNLLKAAEWVTRFGMILNTSKCQHFSLWAEFISNQDDTHVHLQQVMAT